jgi:hypothetical protein
MLGVTISQRVAAGSSALVPWINHILDNKAMQDVLQLAMDLIARVAKCEEALLSLGDDVLDAVISVTRAYNNDWNQPVPNISGNSSYLAKIKAWKEHYPLGAAVCSFMSDLQCTLEMEPSVARKAARKSAAVVRIAAWFSMSAKPPSLANLGQGCLLHLVRADAAACLKHDPELYDRVAAHMVDNSSFADDQEDEDDEWKEIVKRLDKAADHPSRSSSNAREAMSNRSSSTQQGRQPTSSSSSGANQTGGVLQRLSEAAAAYGLGASSMSLTRITPESWDQAIASAARTGHLMPGQQQGRVAGPSVIMPSSSSGARGGDSSKSCAVCGSTAGRGGAKLLGCGGCKAVRYCSKECQLQHWKHGGHKDNCKNMRRK